MGEKMKFTALLIAIAVFVQPLPITVATIGPVEVQLSNPNGELRKARANHENTLSIRFRINMDIKVHDWVKVWFPIDEASCDPADICDGLPEINGKLEHPRFVPNTKYFVKFPESEEKKIGKLYDVLDDRRGKTKFESCESNCCAEGKCRIVADKSGLGNWIMGTVMPALQLDEAERYNKLIIIMRNQGFGYNPCDCRGLPFITNTCKERSFQFNSPLEMDAWREGYNPMQCDFGRKTGIIYPATPGRYKVIMATAPEPTPVESELFNLPCSQMTEPKVSISVPELNENVSLSVNFATGEGGALDKNISRIYVRFPMEFSNANKIESFSIKYRNIWTKITDKFEQKENLLSFVVPVDIDAGEEIAIRIDEKQGIMTPTTNAKCQFEVWTDSEPEAVKSKLLSIDDAPYVQAIPEFEMTPANYRLVAQAPKGGIKVGEKIALIFPDSTIFPENMQGQNILVNKSPCTANPTIIGNRLTFAMPINISGIMKIQIIDTKLTNPEKGIHKLEYIFNNIKYPIAEFVVKESIAYIESVKLTNKSFFSVTGFEIIYHPPFSNPIKHGDEIIVEFPNEYELLQEFNNEMVFVNDINPMFMEVFENRITIGSPVLCEFPNSIKITISEEAGIKNSPYGEEFILSVWQENGNIAHSDAISFDTININESKIKLIWDSDDKTVDFDGCTWHNKPPILSFDYCNPFQEIILWFDNKENASINYTVPKKLSPGCMRTVINYYAKIGDKKEKTKSQVLCLDTVPPNLQFDSTPYKNKFTNKTSETLTFKRSWHELMIWGDNEKYGMADGIKLNGKTLAHPEIIDWTNKKQKQEIWKTLSQDIQLVEGNNCIVLTAFDQFGQTKEFELMITRDTIVPEIKFNNFKDGDIVDIDKFNFEIESEPDAQIFFDDIAMVPIYTKSIGKKTLYALEPTLRYGFNRFNTKVADKAGNFTEKVITCYSAKSHFINIRLNEKQIIKDGKDAGIFTVIPTNASPPLPKNFAGTTYVQAETIAKLLGFSTQYDIRQNMLKIWKFLPNRERIEAMMWSGKKTVKINGKDMPLDGNKPLTPLIIGGKLMIPVKFLASLVKGQTSYRSEDKRISVAWLE
jgi:hypothetical protein